MKLNIGNHEFTELWDGVLYKALSNYPNVSDNEMKDIIDFVNYEKNHGRKCGECPKVCVNLQTDVR